MKITLEWDGKSRVIEPPAPAVTGSAEGQGWQPQIADPAQAQERKDKQIAVLQATEGTAEHQQLQQELQDLLQQPQRMMDNPQSADDFMIQLFRRQVVAVMTAKSVKDLQAQANKKLDEDKKAAEAAAEAALGLGE